MAADVQLGEVRDDALAHVPDPPPLDEIIDDAGRQRLAAYYLYSALIAGVLGGDDLAPARWRSQLAEPLQRLGLTKFTPRTGRGLDAQLTPAEQATRRSPGRQFEFAQLLVDLINQGAFGPRCGDADRVRLTAGPEHGQDLELIKGQAVVGTCKVQDHWELVAQQLAGAPLLAPDPGAGSTRATEQKVASKLTDSGIAHAVSLGTTLAVNIHPLGAAAGLGTKLIEARIRTGRNEADTLRQVGKDLHVLRDQADGELNDLRARRTT